MERRPRDSWRNTTHDWAGTVDLDHLRRIGRDPVRYAPAGVRHLILEVVAYAADEAEDNGGGRCRVTLHDDGFVSVADDGRGTDTRLDHRGEVVKKPIMATRDLRFFDHPEAQALPDGHPRRGMSVVAALSERLIHTNRRDNGAWEQRYERGVPVTGLVPVDLAGATGTTVRFLPLRSLSAVSVPDVGELTRLGAAWPHLTLEVHDRRSL
ncbi:ATP-binding protein [Streptomyces sp. NA04227]|uniref:ATP-binding protein n=1 Tax=Streptomyces sp. NA04227 TaxID=2742136 RepID=UPI001590548E|nr:ATP-binding protein [Streptomyces sp. NA04227]QKW07138.1 ATP-binding protein [Streptomyces sp. NA04227]